MIGTPILNAGLVLSLISGIVTIATQKHMNGIKSRTCDTCRETLFDSPFTQMILGSAAVLTIWGGQELSSKSSAWQILHTPSSLTRGPVTNAWMWCLPAVLEVLTGWSYCSALALTDASTILVQRSFTVVTTAIISAAWLQTPIVRGQWLGMVMVTTGIILSLLKSIFVSSVHSIRSELIAAILVALSCVMSSMKMCYQERLLKQSKAAPFQISGLVGMYCMGICAAILVFWPPKRHELMASLYQVSHSLNLFLVTILFAASLTLYACSSIIVTKFGSSIILNFLRCIRTIAIFIIDELFVKSSHQRTYSDWIPLSITILGIAIYSAYHPYTIGAPDHPGGDGLVELEAAKTMADAPPPLDGLNGYNSIPHPDEITNC